jgi:ribosomal protein S18 acetylase RimI-like enzyme
MIRKMSHDDLASVVAIHQRAFKGFFLDQMGSAFLRAYYRSVLNHSSSIALVYLGDGPDIFGFVVGFVNPRCFYKELKRSAYKFFFPIVLGLVRDPRLLFRILSNVSRISTEATTEVNPDSAELSSIGVAKSGLGAGGELLDAFTAEVWRKGVKEIHLTTDSDDNEAVHNFYRKFGFMQQGLESRQGRDLAKFHIESPRL